VLKKTIGMGGCRMANKLYRSETDKMIAGICGGLGGVLSNRFNYN